MSGHSKWSKIKRQKGAADQKRGNQFSKVSKLITIAARKGGDPEMNPALAGAIQKAKSINMPNSTIENAIKKGTGEDTSAAEIEEFTMEAVGSGGVGLLVDCTTDNKNRTLAEVKKILEQHGWSLAEAGAISWQFEAKGLVAIPVVKQREESKDWKKDENKQKPIVPDELEAFELAMIEVDGVLDVTREDDMIEVLTEPKKVGAVAKHISSELKYKIDSYEMIKVTKTPISVDQKMLEKTEETIEAVEDNEDVQNVWANISQ